MATAFEGCVQPDTHDFKGCIQAHHSLTQRDDIRVVVLAAQPSGFTIPTNCAANSLDAIGDNRLSIS
jgi:hypothetical protein